jgi:prevent-host-death family protein
MKTLSIGTLKAHFSEVIDQVRQGETVVVSYGRKKEKVAALIPYEQLQQVKPRKIGFMEGRGQCYIHEDFSMSDEELLKS